MPYRLLRHKEYEQSADGLSETVRRKAAWSQVLLGTRGRTPSVKSTSGFNARWRRTPVQGYHYYLWWIPLSESSLADQAPADEGSRSILVHSIRHHDETDDPIFLRSLAEFADVPLDSLDPRYDEQREVGEQLLTAPTALATIKGLPGSGKTVSLFYLVRDLAGYAGLNSILYLTYTSRLKRAAREFIAAQSADVEEHVRIRTFSEAVGDVLGTAVPQLDPFSDLRDFLHFLDMQQPASLGVWRKYPETLYTELRAYLFGRTFPAGFHLPDQAADRIFLNETNLTPQKYAATRDIDPLEAEQAYRVAERLRDGRFFSDQRAASDALRMISGGRLPSWARSLDALIIDEVQDMTLLQIALIGELARERMRRRPDAPLVLAVAGDESQIVQPSGFDWGTTKDLLRVLLSADPIEFEFRHQRRSPRNIARLIDNAWSFYAYLPKPLRPSANRQSFLDDSGAELAQTTNLTVEDDGGRILICPLPDSLGGAAAAAGWTELIGELIRLPGRALVDLTEELLPALQLPAEAKADEVVFLAREIKGLERGTLLIHGLNRSYVEAVRLAEQGADHLPRLEARRLIDEMRVALSRSTDKLVLLEPPSAPILAELGVDGLEGHFVVGWESLLEILGTEEMSEIEAVEGYLDEADDLLERGRWEQGRSRNRRALELAIQIDDKALRRDAEEQFVRSFLMEAAAQLAQDQLRPAYLLNRQAFDLAAAHGDVALLDEVDEQERTIRSAVARKVEQVVELAARAAAEHDYFLAYTIAHTSADLLTIMQDPALQMQLDEATVSNGWAWAIELLGQDGANSQRLEELFQNLAGAMHRQNDLAGEQMAHLLAERYHTLPPGNELTPEQADRLLRFSANYLQLLAPLDLEPEAFVFVERWLEEAYAGLGDQEGLYYEWALLGQTYALLNDYPQLDERLWDLENRVELAYGPDWKATLSDERLVKFAAFIAAYNGEAAAASAAWERLGQVDLAVEQAREAGDVERAYALLKRAGLPAPEELNVAVKLHRLAQQLAGRHARLRAAERAALAAQLETLAAQLREPTAPAGAAEE